MVSRIVALAILAAALVIGGGAFAWWYHVRHVELLVLERTAVARQLYAQGERRPLTIIRALEAPGIEVIVEDHPHFEVYQSIDGTILHHPGGALPPGPLPVGPAPDVIGPPKTLHLAPGEHFPPPPNPFGIVSAQLAHVAAGRSGGAPMAILVLANARGLQHWLVVDTSIVVVLLLVIAIVATRTGTTLVVAERTRLEAAARERHTIASEYQRFLADAGHELRTPLTIATGYFDILNAQLEPQQNRDIERVVTGLKGEMTRMRALVEKMLMLARLETPVSAPNLVDVGSVAEAAVEAMRSAFPTRDVLLERSGAASIIIDRDDLYEAVRNLIENALKYAPRSRVDVKVEMSAGVVACFVTDYGDGIVASERGAIFERFYRGDGRGAVEGSGLGLAIVRRVADRWGGTVELDSGPSRTVFTLRFPLADEEA